MRSAILLVMLVPPAALVAAPVPKDAKKLAELFGERVDPKGGQEVSFDPTGRLEVVFPKALTPVASAKIPRLRPLFAKDIDGDFRVTVRVAHAVPKGAEINATVAPAAVIKLGPAGEAADGPTVAAGLAVQIGAGDTATTCLFVHRRTKVGDDWKGQYQSTFAPLGGGWSRRELKAAASADTAFLRLSRVEGTYTFEASDDGRKWVGIDEWKTSYTGEVRVGPVAFQNTAEDYTATLDKYELKPTPGEKK